MTQPAWICSYGKGVLYSYCWRRCWRKSERHCSGNFTLYLSSQGSSSSFSRNFIFVSFVFLFFVLLMPSLKVSKEIIEEAENVLEVTSRTSRGRINLRKWRMWEYKLFIITPPPPSPYLSFSPGLFFEYPLLSLLSLLSLSLSLSLPHPLYLTLYLSV